MALARSKPWTSPVPLDSDSSSSEAMKIRRQGLICAGNTKFPIIPTPTCPQVLFRVIATLANHTSDRIPICSVFFLPRKIGSAVPLLGKHRHEWQRTQQCIEPHKGRPSEHSISVRGFWNHDFSAAKEPRIERNRAGTYASDCSRDNDCEDLRRPNVKLIENGTSGTQNHGGQNG